MKAPTTISQDEDDVHVCMGQEAIRVEATIITESRQKIQTVEQTRKVDLMAAE